MQITVDTDDLGDTVEDLRDRGSELVSKGKDVAGEAADATKQRVGEAADAVQPHFEEARDVLQESHRGRTMVLIGLGAVVVGLGVYAVVRRRRREADREN